MTKEICVYKHATYYNTDIFFTLYKVIDVTENLISINSWVCSIRSLSNLDTKFFSEFNKYPVLRKPVLTNAVTIYYA